MYCIVRGEFQWDNVIGNVPCKHLCHWMKWYHKYDSDTFQIPTSEITNFPSPLELKNMSFTIQPLTDISAFSFRLAQKWPKHSSTFSIQNLTSDQRISLFRTWLFWDHLKKWNMAWPIWTILSLRWNNQGFLLLYQKISGLHYLNWRHEWTIFRCKFRDYYAGMTVYHKNMNYYVFTNWFINYCFSEGDWKRTFPVFLLDERHN